VKLRGVLATVTELRGDAIGRGSELAREESGRGEKKGLSGGFIGRVEAVRAGVNAWASTRGVKALLDDLLYSSVEGRSEGGVLVAVLDSCARKEKEPFPCVPLKKMAFSYRPLKSSFLPRCHDTLFLCLPSHFVHVLFVFDRLTTLAGGTWVEICPCYPLTQRGI
jgi:hypothetical protein